MIRARTFIRIDTPSVHLTHSCFSAIVSKGDIFFDFRFWYTNILYTDGLLHCYKVGESICHFSGVGSVLSLLFYF